MFEDMPAWKRNLYESEITKLEEEYERLRNFALNSFSIKNRPNKEK